MTGANICDTETYTSAAGIIGKCSVLCINLIRGGDKDSLHNVNCKIFCEDCYTYYSTKVHHDTTTPPAFTYKTPVQTTTALFPPSNEFTLTLEEIVGIVLAFAVIAILVQDVLLILACRKSRCLRNKLLGCKDGKPGENTRGMQNTQAEPLQPQEPPQQTAPPAAQPLTTQQSGTSNNGVVVRNGRMQPNPGGPLELEDVRVEGGRGVDQKRIYPRAGVPGPSTPSPVHESLPEEKVPLMPGHPQTHEQQPRVPGRVVRPRDTQPLGIPQSGALRAGVVPASGDETEIKVPCGGHINERRPIRGVTDINATQDQNEGDVPREVVDDIGIKECPERFFDSPDIVVPEQVSQDLKPGSSTDKGKGNHPRKGHRSGGSKKVS